MASTGASSSAAPASCARKRLLRDFKRVQQDAPEGISAAPMDNNIFMWEAIIFGPDDTPLEGGVFKLHLRFSEEYPQCPPHVKFQTSVFHPNVFTDGNICLDILRREKWSASYDISALLVSIQSLLASPDLHRTPEGGANPDAERLFVNDKQAYDRKVKEIVANQLADFDDEDFSDDEDEEEMDDGEETTRSKDGAATVSTNASNTDLTSTTTSAAYPASRA